MAQIKVNVDQLRNDAKRLARQIAALESEQIKLIALVAKIADSWEGAASAALINKIKKEIETSKKVINILKKYKKYIDNTIEKFEGADKKAAKRIRGSF